MRGKLKHCIFDRKNIFFKNLSGLNEFYFIPPQDNSKWRRHYLNSLYEYMHGCNKELGFLEEEQDKIKKQDWSDRMVDPPDIRRQYEVSNHRLKLLVQNNLN